MTIMNSSSLQRAMSDHRARIDSAQATFGRERKVEGSVLIEGIGRTGLDVVFPIIFVRQPHIVFGQHLDTNEHYDVNIPAHIDATVSRWVTRQADPNNVLWTGCRILATTRGHATQRQVLTWRATGLAINANPAKLGSTMDTL
jgi:hypothetical protein